MTLSTGRIHVSKYEVNQSTTATLADKLKLNLTRPFVLLFTESIVLLFSVYAAVVYGIREFIFSVLLLSFFFSFAVSFKPVTLTYLIVFH